MKDELKNKDFSKDVRHGGKTKDEVVKDVQRLLLENDFDVETIFDVSEYMKENLESNVRFLIEEHARDEDKKFVPKGKTFTKLMRRDEIDLDKFEEVSEKADEYLNDESIDERDVILLEITYNMKLKGATKVTKDNFNELLED